MNAIFNRLQRLTSIKGFDLIQSKSVIIFGVGGVGSWCAESLIRSGIKKLTIIDSDLVCTTNINRQLQATCKTIGKVKVEILKERLLEINPKAQITAMEKIYNKSSAHEFDLNNYDYTIDAIDSLSCKVDLIEHACNSDTTLFSALGASSKLDPTRIKTAPIWETHGCRLGRFVRKRLRKRDIKREFICVYSDEILPVFEVNVGCGSGECLCPKKKNTDGTIEDAHEWCSSKQLINGSIVHITGIFGFYLSGLVMQDILKAIPEIKPLHNGYSK